MNFQALPGFRDFYPEDCALRDSIFNIWRKTSESFGFRAYDGPPLEPLELFTTKSGEEIVHQLYNFQDKGERAVTLRPEMTPTLARMVGSRHRDYKKPIKWYSIPQVFRYERTQKGRLREHFQWNADIFGEIGLGADAELLALLASSMKAMGFTSDDVVLRVSDRLFWSDFLQTHNVPADKHYDFFQALDKIDRAEESDTRQKLGHLADEVYSIFQNGATSPRLDTLMQRLDTFGILPFVQVDLKIVRGLAYYTGIVFEMHDRKGEFRAIAGGGRYDNLVQLLSGQDLPAAGFGFGDVVIGEMIKARGLMPDCRQRMDYFVLIGDEALRAPALKLVAQLRAQGHSVDYPLEPMKFNKQLELATERNATQALILEKEAWEKNQLQLRNLTTREQSMLTVSTSPEGFSLEPPLP